MINLYRREQAKLENVRTVLNAYDRGNISRERVEAAICHQFLPRLSRAISRSRRSDKARIKGEKLMKPLDRW